ncbi:hypothetical protein KM043_006503 [Ampulex compressa]|nr:hypothetical protein KM043_006503 [Ampulex compressa]
MIWELPPLAVLENLVSNKGGRLSGQAGLSHLISVESRQTKENSLRPHPSPNPTRPPRACAFGSHCPRIAIESSDGPAKLPNKQSAGKYLGDIIVVAHLKMVENPRPGGWGVEKKIETGPEEGGIHCRGWGEPVTTERNGRQNWARAHMRVVLWLNNGQRLHKEDGPPDLILETSTYTSSRINLTRKRHQGFLIKIPHPSNIISVPARGIKSRSNESKQLASAAEAAGRRPRSSKRRSPEEKLAAFDAVGDKGLKVQRAEALVEKFRPPEAHGPLRAGDDSFRFVNEGADGSSFLRKIRSPGNCDRSSGKEATRGGAIKWRLRKGARETFTFALALTDAVRMNSFRMQFAICRPEKRVECRLKGHAVQGGLARRIAGEYVDRVEGINAGPSMGTNGA